MKDKLVFDTTDASTMLDSDNIGAYLRSSDGTLITHTVAGAKKALDVYIANTLNVELDGIYDSVNNSNPDNVGLILHTRAASPADAQQVFRPTGGNPSSDDLSPANIHAMDTNAFNMAWDGSAWDRLTATAGALNVNVSSGADLTLANVAIVATSNTLDTADTAELAVTTALSARKYLYVYNMDNNRIYVGGAGVTAATGFPLSPSSVLELRAGAASAVHFVGSAGKTPEIRTLELS